MTRRDIVTKIVRSNLSPTDTTVGEICSRPVFAVPPDMSLREAASAMADKNFSRLLVEKDGDMIGIASETDIFETVERFGWAAE